MAKKATKSDLLARADKAIKNKEETAYDTADNLGLMLDNVAHLSTFLADVANTFIEEDDRYSHLAWITVEDVKQWRRRGNAK